MQNWIHLSLVLLVLTLGAVPDALAFSKESLVWKKCTGCHAPANGKIARVEEMRTTPEEWTVIVDRMSRLHGMDLTTAEMGNLLKELCSTQILSPAELDKVSYLNLLNNPQNMEVPKGAEEEKLFVTCVRCHSGAKIYSYRMTTSAWAKIRDFHLYMVPTTVNQMREMRWEKEADTVLASLARSHPYTSAWQTPTEKPSGSWLILGYEPGKGNYRGQATINHGGNEEYAVKGKLQFSDGTTENFSGEGTLYGGHAFRTRTQHDGNKTRGAYSFTDGTLKGEHHFPAPDFRTSQSTWYPANGPARLLRVAPAFLLKGEKTLLVLEGVGLPDVAAGDLSISGGSVAVTAVRRIGPEALEVEAVSSGDGLVKAAIGIKGLNSMPLTLADRIDSISILPEMGRSRLYGGRNYPAEGVQYQALALAKGDGGEVALGPVPARFKLAAEVKRPNDDDLVWAGSILPNGKYIPMGDYSSNPARAMGTDGGGIVKVEAEYRRGEQVYAAKPVNLIITMPDFVQRIK